MKQFIRIRLESIDLMENYWEIKSRLEVDGAVFSLQALQPYINHGLEFNRLPQYYGKSSKFFDSFISL